MCKKVILILCFFFYCIFYNSAKEDLILFLKKNDSPLLNELFTINTGIMELKNIGNIKTIDPLDSQNVVNSIKNVLEKVPAIRLSRKEAVLKAINVFISKLKEEDKEKALFLKRKFFYSQEDASRSLIYELFLEFRKNEEFYPIAKQWFENIENPFYIQNISVPFKRVIKSEDEICKTQKANEKGPLDFLIHGEIEKIDNLYFVTIFVYSGLLKRRIKEFSFVSDSENISKKSMNKMHSVLSSIFSINYASLLLDTEDEDVRIYIDSDYVGRNKIFIDYLVPGRYVITLKKEKYENKIENINLLDFEKKEITLNIEKKLALQIVDFYIEPFGTKIFINSVFQGRSPFKKALSKGNYVISVKNALYESHRYLLLINEIKKKELTVVFHLKSKDVKNYFKLKKYLYYSAFWNFTFSLITTVPLLVFANQYWNIYGRAAINSGLGDSYQFTKDGQKLYRAMAILYGFSAAFTTYTILSLGWLFYALADYLLILEKKDFIPILEYYKNLEGAEGITLGMQIRF